MAFGDDAWAPPEGMAVDDASITTTIDVTAFWDAKLAALAAHASQADAVMLSTLFALGDGADPIARVEEYVRGCPVVEGAAREDDLFPGWPHSVD